MQCFFKTGRKRVLAREFTRCFFGEPLQTGFPAGDEGSVNHGSHSFLRNRAENDG
jgi:hypothetical protein